MSHDAELLHPHGNQVVEEAFMDRLEIRQVGVIVGSYKCYVRWQLATRLDWQLDSPARGEQ